MITALELQTKNIPPPKWAVEGFLPEGVALLCGDPKAGKTLLTLSMCLDICNGVRVFGQYKTPRAPCLYISYEQPEREFKQILRQMMPFQKKWPGNLHIVTNDCLFSTMGSGGMAALHREIGRYAPLIVVIDVWEKFRPKNGGKGLNHYSIDYSDIGRIKELAGQYAICIFLIHHTNKNTAHIGFQKASGTSGLTGAVDCNFLFERHQNAITGKLSKQGRLVKSETFRMRFEETMLRWQILGEEEKTSGKWKMDRVLECFRLRPGIQMKASDIAAYTGLDTRYLNVTLRRLSDPMRTDCIIERPKYGIYQLKENCKCK